MGCKAIGPALVVDLECSSMSEETSLGLESNAESTTATTSCGQSRVAFGPTKRVLIPFVSKGHQELKNKGDYAVMKFFVCCGIPPYLVEIPKFKSLVATLNGRYQPPSASTLTTNLIPNELAKISITMKKFLTNSHHLTITFDGGKTRQPHSVYTIHVTTADRRTFCLDLDDGARLSHSGKYVLEALDRVSCVVLRRLGHLLTF
jgi:hypothetical protein